MFETILAIPGVQGAIASLTGWLTSFPAIGSVVGTLQGIVGKIPIVGDVLGAFGDAIGDILGGRPDPPDPPAGFHWGPGAVLTRSMQFSYEPSGIPGEPGTYGQPTFEPRLHVFSNTLIDDKSGVPVAYFASNRNEVVAIAGFMADGFAVSSKLPNADTYIGKPASAFIPKPGLRGGVDLYGDFTPEKAAEAQELAGEQLQAVTAAMLAQVLPWVLGAVAVILLIRRK